ncbi:hypothetical protein BMS70_08035 [Leuconostoc mesenteroides subsp. cremoris]|nr:hypothetical protein LMT8_08195 [Leuconostoc mesenteroides subsp. cremoris TIFN8]ORI45015.1 hypothetical protein BMR95_08200 [Leuconostoc mesenteroides subsp. cremoris]ORI45767.1 hypothetical protein BMR97_08110 [Leuconostoc mesenteroides subsp. cremoris]ORI48377.1 hypothetical protein BMR98_08065 [Leuconostoc mesenteroides subsp. cremoris]ORI55275.1 hypothetical protein BMS67_08365 [Leuconostoc mesenteroides subsp. cremoris]
MFSSLGTQFVQHIYAITGAVIILFLQQKGRKFMMALMSRLWTDFFGTESCRTPKVFQNPDFSLKRRDFWVFL